MAVTNSFNPGTVLKKDDNYVAILDDLPACLEYEPGFYFGLRTTAEDEATIYWIDEDGCPQPLFIGEIINNTLVNVGGLRPLIVCLSELDADLAAATDVAGPVPVAYEGEIVDAGIVVDQAPTGANILVDVNKNGSSIFGAQKLQIDATETKSNTASNTAAISTSSISQFDILTFDIDQVGSTIAGQNLRIFLLINQLASP